jgi:hypothetical protein
VAWLETFIGHVYIMMYPEGHADETDAPSVKSEPGPTLRLMFVKNGRPIYWTLTALTSDELDKLKTLLDMAFDIARPIVEERDKAAQHAYDTQGDDSIARLYRAVSRLIVREGAITENSTSVRQRPEDDAAGPGGPGDSDEGLRVIGPELADVQPEAGGVQDDGTQADESPGVRPVGWMADL